MFTEYNPLNGKRLQILDSEGKVVQPQHMPDDNKILEAYNLMLYARIVDEKAVSFQRQGRMYTYPPNFGQEASAAGTGMALEEDDWLVPAYREMAAWLHRGMTAKDVFMFWGGFEEAMKLSTAKNMLPLCVPIASQVLHAVGIAHSLKYKEKDGIVLTYIGDGGTSEGDFHEALNFAGVWKVPVIFICQNNQYAISLPQNKQTASTSIAIKSIAYGIKGLQVDGNDFCAVYSAAKKAVQHTRQTKEPVLIECITYRRGAHTTSDDPSRYRSREEEQVWAGKDPLKRLRLYLATKGLWDEQQEQVLQEQYQREIDLQFSEFESMKYDFDDVFRYMYSDIPEDLKKQQFAHQKFLKWEEAQQWQ